MKVVTHLRNKYWLVSLLSISLIATSGCGGLSSKQWKTIGAVVVVAVAAKLIYDMSVDYQSKQVNDEGEVVARYKKENGKLPDEPQLVSYETQIRPGGIVSAGNEISIQSHIEVVRSADSRSVDIQEKIIIFDNEDNTKELKSLTKVVNKDTNASGAFENEFVFKLPEGLPQGIYPIKTIAIINGVEYPAVDNQMQLVKLDSMTNQRVASTY